VHATRRFITLALSFLGLFDSIYLWWAYTSPSHPLVCVVGTGCDTVRASSYSHLWGLPLPLFGAAMYGALAILCFAEVLSGMLVGKAIRFLILIISGAGFLISLVLSGIEAFRLHTWCAWCVLSAIVVMFIFILAIDGIWRPSPPVESLIVLKAVRAQFALFVIALGIGIAAFVHLSHSGEFAASKPASTAVLDQRLVRADSPVTGNPQASVTVVEFGDFECSICKLAQISVGQMLEQYGSKIRFVFRQFPMSSADPHMHPEAEKAAEASECAAAQGKFWQADQLFFQKQPDLSVPDLETYASQLGLNTAQFDQCLSSGAMASRVHQDFEDGWAVGVRATPTLFVGHQMIVGPPRYPELAQLLDNQLASHGAGTSSAPPGNPLPAAASSTAPSGTMTVGNPFSQLQQANPLACSANEANMPQPTLIRTPEAQKLFQSTPKPIFVDVRELKAFAAGHIAGAINIPVEDIEQKWNALPKNRLIVFYEGGEQGGSPDDVCAFSRAAARVLFQHEYDRTNVKVYQDGLKAWEKAGLPVAR
jgi:protein-disulfide isomerase/rhodanese-related sulfurtransferase